MFPSLTAILKLKDIINNKLWKQDIFEKLNYMNLDQQCLRKDWIQLSIIFVENIPKLMFHEKTIERLQPKNKNMQYAVD